MKRFIWINFDFYIIMRKSICNVTFWLMRYLNISVVNLTVCYYQVTYAFQSESAHWIYTLKHVRDMTITCSQMHDTDRYSGHSSIIWPVWLNGWAFVHKLSGCRLKSRCCHLNVRYRIRFEQGGPWHSDNYRV